MWSKMRSLSLKLTLIYVLSTLAVIAGIMTYIEYNNHQRELSDAMRQAEVGPGFINGATPQNTDFAAISNTPAYVLRSVDIDNRMSRFKTFFDWKAAGGVAVSTQIKGPITIEHQDYYDVSFLVTTGTSQTVTRPAAPSIEVGPITIPRSNFPATIAAYLDYSNTRTNDIYYLPVSGYDNMVWVVSLNRYPSIGDWQQNVISDLLNGLPLILVFAIIFGILIAWITVGPLKRITSAVERISRSDLSQRVNFRSHDEIGRLAVSFNTMADRLEDSFNSQKRFVSDAAHELRTPLASMKTSVTKTLDSEIRNEDHQKLLNFLSGRIDHMETLVNDLLFLSRVDEGRFNPDEAKVNISDVLNEAEEAFRYLLDDKGIAFTVEIQPELEVKGDRKLLLRVVSNLLDNAAKNTPSGSAVSLRAFEKGYNIILIVNDTGPGIPQEHISHLFERFYKIPNSSGHGFGLGLAISKSIIASAGGGISAQSELGKGSTFTIELPLYKDSSQTNSDAKVKS